MTDDEGQAFFARIEYLEQQLAECQTLKKSISDMGVDAINKLA
jgi:hypothetical protein